jgi:hypothetical protein
MRKGRCPNCDTSLTHFEVGEEPYRARPPHPRGGCFKCQWVPPPETVTLGTPMDEEAIIGI